MFGSLTPVWTRLGMHAMDTSDPTAPKVAHAFVPRRHTWLHDQGDLGHARHAPNALRHRYQLRAQTDLDRALAADGVPP
jgi:hypothetical protein